MTVPPGEGLIYANVRGQETPYTRARLRKEDKGKGIGGPGDGETIDHHAQRLPRLQDHRRPGRRQGFHGGPRADPRPDAQGPGGRSRRQAGRRRAMLRPRARPGASSRRSPTRPSRSTAWSRAIPARSSSRTRNAGWSARSPSRTRTSRARPPLEVRLGPPGSVKGRLVDEDGLPLAGATLSVMSYRRARRPRQPAVRPRRALARRRDLHRRLRRPVRGHRASSRASGASSASTSRPDRIPASTPARSSGTSCPSVSARSATSAR